MKLAISTGAGLAIFGAIIVASGVLAIVMVVHYDHKITHLQTRIARLEGENKRLSRQAGDLATGLGFAQDNAAGANDNAARAIECLGEAWRGIVDVAQHIELGAPGPDCKDVLNG